MRHLITIAIYLVLAFLVNTVGHAEEIQRGDLGAAVSAAVQDQDAAARAIEARPAPINIDKTQDPDPIVISDN